MKNITNLCIELQEGKINKNDFLREARRTFPHYITNVNTFTDTIKILRNKNLITEGCNCENQLDEAVPRDEEHDNPIDFDTDNLRIPRRSVKLDLDSIEPSTPDEQDLEILRNLDIYGSDEPEEYNYDEDEEMYNDEYEWDDELQLEDLDPEDEEDDYEWQIDKDEYDIEQDYDADLELIDFDNDSLYESKEYKPMGSKWNGSDSKYNGIEGGDEIDPLELQIGKRYERGIDPIGSVEKWEKKVKSNLKKDARYYTKLSMAGWDVKKMEPEVKKRTDLPVEVDKKMSNTTDKNNKMSTPKGVEKIKASANKAKKETIKPVSGVKDLTHKAVKTKGIKQVMNMTGGKMKKIKSLNELCINDPNALYKQKKAEQNQDLNELEANSDSLLDTVQNFINSKFSEISKNIKLTESKMKVYLKYDYWDELPSNVLNELETKFNVRKDATDEGEDGVKTFYVLSPKITSEMMQEIKRRIKKLFKK